MSDARKATSTNYENERGILGDCPFSRTLAAIGGRWGAVVLWKVANGARRFGALRREIPAITEKMLAQELRRLEAHALLSRRVLSERPPHVEYTLTAAGEGLRGVLRQMFDWGEAHPDLPPAGATGTTSSTEGINGNHKPAT